MTPQSKSSVKKSPAIEDLEERLLETEALNRQLMDINNAVTPFRTREQVMKIIELQLKRTVPVDSFYLSVYSKDLTRNIFFLEGMHDKVKAFKEVQDYLNNGNYDYVSTKVFNTGAVIDEAYLRNLQTSIIHYKDLTSDFLETYPIAKAEKEAGFKEGIILPLKVDCKIIGAIILSSFTEKVYPTSIWPMLEKISEPIAIGVSNVLLYEEMQAAKAEIEALNQQLMDINNAVTPFRTRAQVMRIIGDQLKRVVDFSCFYIATFHDDYRYFRFFLNELPEAVKNSANIKALHGKVAIDKVWGLIGIDPKEYYEQQKLEKFMLEDFIKAAEKDKVQIADLCWQHGDVEALAIPLFIEGRNIGNLMLHSRRQGYFEQLNKDFILKIAEPIAIGVSNVLLYEEMQAAKAEIEALNQQLMDINNAVTPFRTRGKIVEIVGEQLRKIVSFDSFYINSFRENGDFYKFFLDGLLPEIKEHPDVSDFVNRKEFPTVNIDRNPINSEYIQSLPIQCLNYGDLPEEFLESYAIARVEKELGLQTVLVLPLRLKGVVIGTVNLCSFSTIQFSAALFPLLEKIAEPIAIGVSNVLLYEEMQAAKAEIEEREKEKSDLLEITKAIALIKDEASLFQVFRDEIKKYFDYEIFSIVIINEFEGWYRHLNVSASPQIIEHPLFVRNLDSQHPYKGSINEYIAEKFPACASHCIPDYGSRFNDLGVKILTDAGLNATVHMRLEYKGQLIGLLYLMHHARGYYDNINQALFLNFGKQLSIAVANILAHKEIIERERENNLQIAVTNALTSTRDWEDAFRNLAKTVFQFIPFYSFAISFRGNIDLLKQSFVFRKVGDNLERWNSVIDIKRISGWDDETFVTHVKELEPFYLDEGILTGIDHQRFAEKYAIPNLFTENFGFRSSLRTPFTFNEQKTQGHLYLSSRDADGFSKADLGLIQKILPALSLALENLFAFDDIEQREKEKSLQLAAIGAITNHKDWEQKCFSLTKVFEQVLPFDYAVMGFENIQSTPRSYGFQRLGRNEYRTIHMHEFQKMCGITEAKYLHLRKAWRPTEAGLLNGVDFSTAAKEFEILQLRKKVLGVRSCLWISVLFNPEMQFTMVFYSSKEAVFEPSHLQVLEKMKGSLSITLEKLMALEEVEIKQQEIEKLNKQLKQQNDYLIEEVKGAYNFEEIVGQTDCLKEVFKSIDRVAGTDTTVLVLGETGTGKELIARAIHNGSPRKAKPLVKINCAALPAHLIESELFGHERGAFTGAIDRRIGKFEIANGSTLFLDEIGEMPLDLQAKLLRAIQEKEIERLGSNKIIKVDVRIIAATNRDLAKEAREGRFRQDLYYRLNVFPVFLPPLRERREDIPVLCAHFVQKFAKKLGKPLQGVSNRVLNDMFQYLWPGNIRELEHLIERSAILCNGKIIEEIQLPQNEKRNEVDPGNGHLPSLVENERMHIIKALKLCGNKISGPGGVAELLDINPTTLISRMKKLGIRKKTEWDSSN